MDQGSVVVYHGNGAGKSSAALGKAVRTAGKGGSVYIITFLKGQTDMGYISRLEPELKIFRFERLKKSYDDMSESERIEEMQNIKNGMGFARKVLATGECELLVLDEVLGAVWENVLPEEELLEALSQKSPDTSVILTGRHATEKILKVCDVVYCINKEK